MDFVFPKEGVQIKQVVLDAGLWAVVAVIGFVLALWLAKPFLRWLLRQRSEHLDGKRTREGLLLKTLNAEPLDTNRQGGFIVGRDGFAALDGDDVEHDNYPTDTDHQAYSTSCDMSDVEYLDCPIGFPGYDIVWEKGQ